VALLYELSIGLSRFAQYQREQRVSNPS
jgi:hypothetical protein